MDSRILWLGVFACACSAKDDSAVPDTALSDSAAPGPGPGDSAPPADTACESTSGAATGLVFQYADLQTEPNARVTAWLSEDYSIETIADAEGRYEFGFLEAGVWLFSAQNAEGDCEVGAPLGIEVVACEVAESDLFVGDCFG